MTTIARDPQCGLCPLNDGIAPCQLAPLAESSLIAVTERPLGKADKARLSKALGGARVTAMAKCGGGEKTTSVALKACRDAYLVPEVLACKPTAILALGAKVAKSLGVAGKLDLVAGQRHSWNGVTVIPTYSWAQVRRDPTLKPVWRQHLRLARRIAQGASHGVKPTVVTVDTGQAWSSLYRALRAAQAVAFDIETNTLKPHAVDARIESIALTTWTDKTGLDCFAVPLGHPQSKYAREWQAVLTELKRMASVPARIAHNGKFDCKWLQRFGLDIDLTWDTMLAASLLDENRRLSLKHIAQTELDVEPWAIDALACADLPLADVLEYNALDTFYTMQLYLRQRIALGKDYPKLGRILSCIMVPASNALTVAEGHALPVDEETIASNRAMDEARLALVDGRLAQYVDGEPKWNSPKWLADFLYNVQGFECTEYTSKGAPSTGKAAMGALRKAYPDNELLGLLDKRRKLEKKIAGFYDAYSKQLESDGQLRTTFRLGQTVTGRTSSGKEVGEGSATDSAGINLQQVPRDPDIRGLFRAPEGWLWVEADYSQLELRVAASIAHEETMIRLYRSGADLHRHTAQQISGQEDVTKEWRTRAKAVNFGFLYGMGAPAFLILARDSYGVDLTLDEANEWRENFFRAYPGLRLWHKATKELAQRQGYVETPFGRRRRLPILLEDHADEELVARALRQSVNSPVQGQGSDMCLWSLGRVHTWLKRQGLRARIVGTVHDSIDLIAPRDEAARVAVAVKQIMQRLPMRAVFGTTLACPIQADVQVGPAWGEGVELDERTATSVDATEGVIRGLG